jgi:hypothetical protein
VSRRELEIVGDLEVRRRFFVGVIVSSFPVYGGDSSSAVPEIAPRDLAQLRVRNGGVAGGAPAAATRAAS